MAGNGLCIRPSVPLPTGKRANLIVIQLENATNRATGGQLAILPEPRDRGAGIR